jgi:hypothetical protein
MSRLDPRLARSMILITVFWRNKTYHFSVFVRGLQSIKKALVQSFTQLFHASHYSYALTSPSRLDPRTARSMILITVFWRNKTYHFSVFVRGLQSIKKALVQSFTQLFHASHYSYALTSPSRLDPRTARSMILITELVPVSRLDTLATRSIISIIVGCLS